MRFERLALARYGHFTGFALDFGPKPDAGPDLHVVYGPNEAGKSTIFAAMIDLMFGMPTRTPYNFLHDYKAMLIEADADLGDGAGPQRLQRIKQPRNSLLDRNGAPLHETVFSALAGLQRQDYVAMFSLDAASLAEGAVTLLGAEGDFGEILFGASAGLAAISRDLASMRGESDALYRHRAHATELAGLKARIEQLRKDRAAVDLGAADFARLTDAREGAQAAADAALKQEAEVRRELARLERLKGGLDALRKLKAAREALAALGDVKAAPEGWADQAAALLTEGAGLQARVEAAESDLKQKQAARAALALDPTVLAAADAIAAVAALIGDYAGAIRDIPKRQSSAAVCIAEAQAVAWKLGRIGIADPGALLLDAPATGAISDLLAEQPRLAARLEAARDERDLAQAKCGTDAGPSLTPDALTALEAALHAADHSTAEADAANAERRRRAALKRLDDALAQLAPWTGDADTLLALPVPPAGTREGWRRTTAEWERAKADIRAERRSLNQDMTALAQRTIEAEAESAVLDDAAFAELRARRDDAWSRHRAALDLKSAEAFARLMTEADGAGDARFQNVAAVAERRQIALDRLKLEVSGEALARREAEALEALAAIQTAIDQAAVAAGLPKAMDLDRIEDWLERRETALTARAEVQQEALEGADHAAAATAIRAALVTALAGAGKPIADDAGLAALKAIAAEVKQSAAQASADLDALAKREAALKRAEAAMQAWQERWQAALDGLWLAELADKPGSVREALAALPDLRSALDKGKQYLQQVQQMQEDKDEFRQALEAALDALALPPEDDLKAQADALVERLRTAKANQTLAKDQDKAIAAAEALLREREEALAEHQRQADAMTRYFEVDDLPGVLAAISQAGDRERARRDAEDARAALCQAAVLADAEAAEASVAAIQPDAHAAEIARLQAALPAIAEAAKETHHAARMAAAAVDGVAGDAEAAVLDQERQTAILEIADASLRYLRLKLGTLAAEHALARFRQRHQSAMLQKASDTFRRITRGSFAGLATQPKDGKEVLVALRADGSSVIDDDKTDKPMSVGTRAQLYLSLRVAAYHELAARGRPLPPFVADDILETFDDDRARETFEVLGEMSKLGQVIYLTHHAHLMPIAEAAAPGARRHSLPPRSLNPTCAP